MQARFTRRDAIRLGVSAAAFCTTSAMNLQTLSDVSDERSNSGLD